MADEAVWMTRQEVAEHLGVHANTVDHWRRNEGLPFARVGAVLRFDMAAVDEWFRQRAARADTVNEEAAPDR